jgi:glucose/arabinose dehydrogenase
MGRLSGMLRVTNGSGRRSRSSLSAACVAFLLFSGLFLFATGASASTLAQSSSGLVAGFAFDEGAGTTAGDVSGNGLSGTLTNGATWGSGRYGNAVQLDGADDFVGLGNPALLQLTGSMTVSAWVNSAAFPGDDAAIVSKRDGSEVGYQLDTTIDRGPRTIGFKLTNSSGGQMFRYGATTMLLNTWYHVAGVYNAATSELHVYLNGQSDDGVLVGTPTSSQRNSALAVNIGRRPSGGFNSNGRIDDVRIYPRALTQTEVQADMNAPLGTTSDPPPTVAITSPGNNAQVAGIVNVTADASDNIGVVGVQFLVDGANVGAEDSDPPYALAWDTRTAANGAHTLTARARDAAGNSTLSTPVAVNVANSSSFQNEVLATGFNLPTSIEFLPDGRMLVVELQGTIKVMSPPYTTPSPTPFLQLTNVGSAGVQQGIYDIALDPAFSTNHFYYIFYTLGSPNRDRLSRFTANATITGTIAGSELVLYQDPQDANAEHHGGAINFGNDGKLYFTTGEHVNAGDAQLLTSPRGKIHRINLDGSVPTDNPFYDGAGPNVDSIWALGLRNPFRAYYDAPTGRFYIGDVGGNDYSTAREEVDLGARGANYGWPDCENGTCGRFTAALYSYPHNGRDASITGGFVYHGTSFPSEYQGSYFFADYTQNWIKRITFDASGNVSSVFNFEPADGALDGPYGDIVYLTEGPDGALYYVDLGYSDIGGTFGVSKIRRIRYTQGNQAPIAIASANPTSGPAPLDVNFSSVGSSDPEGQPLTYAWTFGDNTSSSAPNPTHRYSQAGQYSARLSVSDGVNTTFSTPLTIRVGSPPTATVVSPQDGSFFVAGDVISFSGDGTDPDDGTLPASAFTWNIDFLHEGHVHPGTPITGQKNGTFTIPTQGHDFSGNTRYRIALTVTDSAGLTSTQYVLIYPRKVNLSFDTVPSGLTLYLDGIAKTTPFVYDTLIGFNHAVEARNQTSGTSAYTFSSWSDGGAQTHTITVPSTPATYTASFVPAPSSNRPPVAVATASATTGTIPLTIQFNGSQSSDPDGDPLTYSWDLNGDGTFGDSTAVAPTFTYTKPGRVTVRLRVTDDKGASATATLSIQPKKN